MPRLLRACLLLILGLGADSAGAANHARDQWTVDAAQRLATRGEAKSLATAAVLLLSANAVGAKEGVRALDLAERAALAAPDDHPIGWIHLRVCEQTPGCDLPGVATTLRWTDADNAAPWMPMLAAAIRDKDDQAMEHALTGMAEGKRFYLYRNPTVTMLFDAVKAGGIAAPPGLTNADRARLDASVSFSARIIPPLRAVAEACKDVQTRPRRHEACVRIAALLQRSDTVAAQAEGYAVQKRLFPPDAREVRTAVERLKNLESRMRAERRFETAFLPWFNNRLALHRLALMRQFAREEDVMNAILREHHIYGDLSHD